MLMGRSTNKLPWLQLGVEALLVVLSVLLALALNNWRDSQANEDMADRALRNLEREIRENRAEILAVLPYHKALLDTLRSENPPTGISMGAAAIQNNAWEAAQSAGVVAFLDFSIVAIASRIQETQRKYQSEVETISAIMLRGNFGGNYELELVPNGLRIIVGELIGLEEKLLAQYNEAMEKIEA